MKKIILNFVILSSIALFASVGCKDEIDTSKEQDEQNLTALYQEIETLANQFSCENATEWKVSAIGAKACGGPTGYIAYSSKINENTFLNKVSTYTKMQERFNSKWNVASDCMFVTAPKAIECNDNKPKFVY